VSINKKAPKKRISVTPTCLFGVLRLALATLVGLAQQTRAEPATLASALQDKRATEVAPSDASIADSHQVLGPVSEGFSVVLARVRQTSTVVFKEEDTYPDCLVYDQYDLLLIQTNGSDYNLEPLLAANKPRPDKASVDKVLLGARWAKRKGKVLDFKIKPGDLVELSVNLFDHANIASSGKLARIQVVDTIGDYSDRLFLIETIKILKPAEQVKKSDLWNGKDYSNVVVGKSGYLFYAADRFLEVAATDPVQLKDRLVKGEEGSKIAQLHDWLKQRGVELIVMIVPIRANALSNEFPADLKPPNAAGATYGSVFNEFYRQRGVNTIYAPQVFQVSDPSKVYYKTGTHWTYYGSFLYYLELMKELAKKFPAVKSVQFGDLAVPSDMRIGDIVLSRLECIDDLIQHAQEPYYWASEAPEEAAKRPEKPSVVIVHDSFYDFIKPFMVGTFKNLKDFYVKQDFIVNDGLIEKFKPDYFVILYCERYLDSIATFKIQ
jgi:hypothetical protein